ncbi:MAG: VIT1/CCC1 transporter family protein [Candidatus Portnoybacteria bacterium]|nr:VIT1/CCC1 transporter family protein [Candidatus Portnoybacteria bacterium]
MNDQNLYKHTLLRHVEDYLGDIILGINDGLVSILGFVAGAYGAVENNLLVFITGVIAAAAAALSMGAAVYLARKSERELQNHQESHTFPALKAGSATTLAFIFFSLFPLLPYLVISGFPAFITSIILTLFALFAAGSLKTLITKEYQKWFLRGFEMMLIGGITAFISYGVGVWIGNITGITARI